MRVINNVATCAPALPQSRRQDAANVLAVDLPTLSKACWVLLPTMILMADTRGRPRTSPVCHPAIHVPWPTTTSSVSHSALRMALGPGLPAEIDAALSR